LAIIIFFDLDGCKIFWNVWQRFASCFSALVRPKFT
jgi:hypothetical protein